MNAIPHLRLKQREAQASLSVGGHVSYGIRNE